MGCSSSNEDVTSNAVRGGAKRNAVPAVTGEWADKGKKAKVNMEAREKMVKSFLDTLFDADKAMLKKLFDSMGKTICKSDLKSKEKILVDGEPTPDQALKLAAYILSATLTEEVTDSHGTLMKVNMNGPLKAFIDDA